MSIYPIHSLETAPEASRPALQGLQQALGLVLGSMAIAWRAGKRQARAAVTDI